MATQRRYPTSDTLVFWDRSAGITNYENVAKEEINDSTYNYYDVFDYWDKFSIDAFTIPVDATINSVKLIARAKISDDSGGPYFGLGFKTPLSWVDNSYYSIYLPLTESFGEVEFDIPYDPDTAEAWTPAGVNDLEGIEYGHSSEDEGVTEYVSRLYIEVDYTPAGADPHLGEKFGLPCLFL